MRRRRTDQPDLFRAEAPRSGDGQPVPEPERAGASAAAARGAVPERTATGTVRVGTSGYSFADWVGPFYPPGTRAGAMLDHYQRRFRTVEINATYYRIPAPATMARMAERTAPDFDFMVKVPGDLTHRRREISAPLEALRRAVAPLSEAGKLAGLLAQFPFSFHRGREAESYVGELCAALAPLPTFVEFRHASWDTPDLPALIESIGCGFCSVDEPSLPGLMSRRAFVSGETAYVRLHGRNARDWWGGGSERYNYLYSPAEMEEWAAVVRRLAGEAKQTYVFFNNCHAGHAVVNARMLEDLLRTA